MKAPRRENCICKLLEDKGRDVYQVERCMYCFHESLPASLPPPVAFSPPKAPPISAPLVGIFTFTMPQSLPVGLKQSKGKHALIKLYKSNSKLDD